MAFSPAELVELNAAICSAALDVADLNASAARVYVDRTGPEFGTVGRVEGVGAIAEIDLELIARLEVQVGEVEHQQLGAAGRSGRAERRQPRPNRLRRAQHLKRAGNVRHLGPPLRAARRYLLYFDGDASRTQSGGGVYGGNGDRAVRR